MRTHGIHSKYPPLVAGHPSPTPPFDFFSFSSIDKTKERTQALFSLLHPTGPAARDLCFLSSSSRLDVVLHVLDLGGLLANGLWVLSF
jgi:hypothetical protein